MNEQSVVGRSEKPGKMDFLFFSFFLGTPSTPMIMLSAERPSWASWRLFLPLPDELDGTRRLDSIYTSPAPRCQLVL